ncbi:MULTISPECIES: putative beta-lysine N-acetyltransferase [unclassified Oceanispirochaeta]|uniref:putative beta-lysine N-acetyltransferase n=1 Tax=unclassified Oceanispirochaeta TaxID=2635722 RepID=UPI0013143CDA|nr:MULTISPECIES: putative beta-lysine N-acetyltransferase [unclassified Oceanispirochaeta]MBF9017966.1 putative beta-lysine N-acetyltransferase [Oceanispirochaeta sp. M2]NPD74477.1 putative beta-lysine N-acetyltransferase [Oceanispirochaeta sp. M1]
MSDKIENIGKSMIHHGKLNDRVYIMKLSKNDFHDVIKRTDELCEKESYSKVFAKVPESVSKELINQGYIKEAEIKNFYSGKENCVFLGKFIEKERQNLIDKSLINDVLKITKSKKTIEEPPVLPNNFYLRDLTELNAKEMADLYKSVFNSYPFPIFDEEYLKQTMKDNIEYAGVFFKNTLVSIASAETYPDFLNAEMTDFATLPKFLGNNFSVILLKYLEKKLISKNYKTLYTIARAKSAGMNITFKKCGYQYSGTLINNTNISGNIESMNIWYKNL